MSSGHQEHAATKELEKAVNIAELNGGKPRTAVTTREQGARGGGTERQDFVRGEEARLHSHTDFGKGEPLLQCSEGQSCWIPSCCASRQAAVTAQSSSLWHGTN